MAAKTLNTRLDVRLQADHKNLIEQAASMLGQSVSSFAVSTLVREAGRVVEESVILKLSNRDRDIFLAMLDNPPEPNDRLRRAFDRHKEQVKSTDL
jgi:uncharacterized protein (DUF1778 family)